MKNNKEKEIKIRTIFLSLFEAITNLIKLFKA